MYYATRGWSGRNPAQDTLHKKRRCIFACQAVGEVPLDLVFVHGFISNLEHQWDDSGPAHLLSWLSAFFTFDLFNKRGTGLSDRVPLDALPTLKQRMDDMRVMDEAHSRRVAGPIGGRADGDA